MLSRCGKSGCETPARIPSAQSLLQTNRLERIGSPLAHFCDVRVLKSGLCAELDLLDRSKARFGVGFITWSLAKQPRLLDLALERRPVAVMLSFGSPVPFIERIKRTGAIVICQVQSVALAKEAAAAGADILIAQGTEAGGHGATRGLVTLVPEIVDALGGRTPVVAAGGIADGRGLAAALMLGAAGVVMGTHSPGLMGCYPTTTNVTLQI